MGQFYPPPVPDTGFLTQRAVDPVAHKAASLPPGMPVYETVRDLLMARCGDDPVHLIYPGTITAAATTFASGFPGTVLYAVKANPHPYVLSTIVAAGVTHFDVASTREVNLITELFPTAKLYLMHPVKSRATIRHAYAMGVRDFAFDCDEELTKIMEETGQADDLALHLRLDIAALAGQGEGGVSVAMPLTGKFGAGEADALGLLRRARRLVARLGVTFHVGSQCLDTTAHGRAIAAVRTLIDEAGINLDSLDVGGGFPVSYPGMVAPAPGAYFAAIADAVADNGFGSLTLLGEPGRALVAEGGATLARIDLRKGRDLYLNDGTYGSLFDAGACGWRYPVMLHGRDGGQDGGQNGRQGDADMTAFRFFGPTCDSIDRMDGPFMLPDSAGEGDWVEIGNLGAYGQTLATRFNGFYTEDTVVIAHHAAASRPARPRASAPGNTLAEAHLLETME